MSKKTSTKGRAKKPKAKRRLRDLPATAVRGGDAASVKGGVQKVREAAN